MYFNTEHHNDKDKNKIQNDSETILVKYTNSLLIIYYIN